MSLLQYEEQREDDNLLGEISWKLKDLQQPTDNYIWRVRGINNAQRKSNQSERQYTE